MMLLLRALWRRCLLAWDRQSCLSEMEGYLLASPLT